MKKKDIKPIKLWDTHSIVCQLSVKIFRLNKGKGSKKKECHEKMNEVTPTIFFLHQEQLSVVIRKSIS